MTNNSKNILITFFIFFLHQLLYAELDCLSEFIRLPNSTVKVIEQRFSIIGYQEQCIKINAVFYYPIADKYLVYGIFDGVDYDGDGSVYDSIGIAHNTDTLFYYIKYNNIHNQKKIKDTLAVQNLPYIGIDKTGRGGLFSIYISRYDIIRFESLMNYYLYIDDRIDRNKINPPKNLLKE